MLLAAVAVEPSKLGALNFASAASGGVIRIITYTQAGTASDLIARLAAKTYDDALHQTIIVENMTGAGGTIAVVYVGRSRPDGKTFLLGNDSVMMAPIIAQLTGQNVSYDPQKDFAPIALLAEADYIVVANGSKGPHTLDELISEAKKRPGQLNYGSAGVGSTQHLGMELLKHLAGIDIVHVPYRGIPNALADVAGGRVDVVLTGIAPALSLTRAGQLKVLGISGNRRSPLIPEAQPISEKVPGFTVTSWFGLFAPAGMPERDIEEFGRNVRNGMKSAEVTALLSAQGIIPVDAGSSELRALLATDTERFSSIVQQLKK